MGRWRAIQKELIQKSIHGEKLDVVQQNISEGKVHGTLYYKNGASVSRGVLLIHGFSGNRYGLGVLAERLAEYGLFCLSIDLPSHFLNFSNFTMGELSETITDGVLLLKHKFGVARVAVVGHSVGAVGALFSNAGYNRNIENNIYYLWEQITRQLEAGALTQKQDLHGITESSKKIESLYTELKQLILVSLKKGIHEQSNVACYIALAPPLNCKKVMPGINLLKKLPAGLIKKFVSTFMHNPVIKSVLKAGNPLKYVPENNPDYIYWQMFKTRDISDFLEYFTNMKEPVDFLSLVEDLAKFGHKDSMINFFEYYQKKYLLAKPKLFIYGIKDLYLMPFLPFRKGKIEKFYESCGNAEIHHGNFTHMMNDNPNEFMAPVVARNSRVTELIFRFLDRNL